MPVPEGNQREADAGVNRHAVCERVHRVPHGLQPEPDHAGAVQSHAELFVWVAHGSAGRDGAYRLGRLDGPFDLAAMEVREFALGAVPGLLQTEGYARALFGISPDATPEKTAERVTARMQRQRKFFSRSPTASLLCLIDELSMRRDAGPGVMAAQVRHLIDAAARPGVTVQLIPAMLHPGLPGSIMLADGAALLETHAGGQVFEDVDTVMLLERRFDKIRSEAFGASESSRRLERIAHELAQEHA
jgi:hypothetical protein